MTLHSSIYTLENPTHLWLDIDETDKARIWQQTQKQGFSTSSRRWVGYLNRLTLNAFLPWLQSEHVTNATVFPQPAALPGIWEVVNGTSINIGTKKLVLIPTEALDLSELRVSQEWVDIPNWIADYYVAVQVNLEEGCIRIWGYATHAQLKNQATYDASDRAYSLDGEAVISNINIIWIAQQLCPSEITRVDVAALPTLPLAQAENLLNRVGNPAVVSPRTSIPFANWGALLEHGGWRQKLYEKRLEQQQQWSVLEWIQIGVSDFAQRFGWGSVELEPSFSGARGSESATLLPTMVRKLTVLGQQYELRVQPKGDVKNHVWRFELRHAVKGQYVPTGFKLQLLTEDLLPFPGNQVQATTSVERLYLEIAMGESGEGLVWVVEPTPENFEYEVLFF
ncbi:MAG: DUF1822 family protein [Calothrix sp. SM1_7_51]|nr:DUF1822 family protein [Calothrix sp. SM1_7_51]